MAHDPSSPLKLLLPQSCTSNFAIYYAFWYQICLLPETWDRTELQISGMRVWYQ